MLCSSSEYRVLYVLLAQPSYNLTVLQMLATADVAEAAVKGGNRPTGMYTGAEAAAPEAEAAAIARKPSSPLCSSESTTEERNAYLRVIGTDGMKQVEGELEIWMGERNQESKMISIMSYHLPWRIRTAHFRRHILSCIESLRLPD